MALEMVDLPISAQNLEALRGLPKLQKMAYRGPGASWNGDWNKVPPVSEFWKAYDARRGGRK
jgi:hypothetical protein